MAENVSHRAANSAARDAVIVGGGHNGLVCAAYLAAAGLKVTTIEGLSADGSHPVQRAWAEVDVPQCGYCQAGQMMSASALLARTPNPTDQEIDAAMTGNICRCGTYLRIREAIHKAASHATNQAARHIPPGRNGSHASKEAL